MSDIHTCSYYCDRPACIKAQRDELRDRFQVMQAALQSGEPVGEVFEVLCEGRIVYAEVYDGAVIPHKAKLYTTPQLVVPPLTLEDLNLIRQWHNAVKDAYVNYLQACDADTFAKIEALLSAGKETV